MILTQWFVRGVLDMIRNMNGKEIVERGYNALGDAYYKARAEQAELLLRQEIVGSFISDLPASGRVLDVGCGPGVPYTRRLAEEFEVVGVDLSETQLELARRNVPGASFVRTDVCDYNGADAGFDGICAFYSIIHIPREDHPALFANLSRMLKPGGSLLVVLGTDGDAEQIEEDFYGQRMFWSSNSPRDANQVIQDAGLKILRSESVKDELFPDSRQWWVLAGKPSP